MQPLTKMAVPKSSMNTNPEIQFLFMLPSLDPRRLARRIGHACLIQRLHHNRCSGLHSDVCRRLLYVRPACSACMFDLRFRQATARPQVAGAERHRGVEVVAPWPGVLRRAYGEGRRGIEALVLGDGRSMPRRIRTAPRGVGRRGTRRRNLNAAPDLNPPHQEQHEDDDKQNADTPGRVVPPALAVRPGWQGADQHEYEDNDQDRSETHSITHGQRLMPAASSSIESAA